MSTSTGWVLRTLVVLALVAGLAALTVGVHAQDDGGERNANREVPDYDIAIDCAYDPGDDRTECTFGARAEPGTKDVGHLDVPDAVACAAVVGGDYEAIDPDPNTGVIGFKSKGGRGQLTLILVGEVAVEGTATYAIKSGDGVFRVPGPGLICGDDPVDAAQGGSPERSRGAEPSEATTSDRDGLDDASEAAREPEPDDDARDRDGVEERPKDDKDDKEPEDADADMVVEDADTDTDVTEIDIVEEDVTNIEDVPDVIAVDIVGEREKDVEDAPDVIQIDIVGESEPTTDAGAAGEVVHGREDADVRGEEAVIPVQQDPIAPVPDPATDVGGTIGDTGVVVQVIGDGLGGIIIRKHVCEDEASAQAGGWFATCTPGDAGTPFRLRTLDTVPATLPRVGTTDAGGVVRFDRLPVGRYHLAEMSGGWCHAKADGVNAAGEIVIEGGQSTTVSIVNCE